MWPEGEIFHGEATVRGQKHLFGKEHGDDAVWNVACCAFFPANLSFFPIVLPLLLT